MDPPPSPSSSSSSVLTHYFVPLPPQGQVLSGDSALLSTEKKFLKLLCNQSHAPFIKKRKRNRLKPFILNQTEELEAALAGVLKTGLFSPNVNYTDFSSFFCGLYWWTCCKELCSKDQVYTALVEVYKMDYKTTQKYIFKPSLKRSSSFHDVLQDLFIQTLDP